MILTVILFISLPLWKSNKPSAESVEKDDTRQSRSTFDILKMPGAKEILTAFFCYCALEQTAMLWGSSFLLEKTGIDSQTAARLASMFCIGITVGRGVNGFLTIKFSTESAPTFSICLFFIL